MIAWEPTEGMTDDFCFSAGIVSDVLESLDVRYKCSEWTLELMQEEEQRILQKLSKHTLKVF